MKGKFWAKVSVLAKEGQPIFGAMDPMPDAFVLWNHIKEYHPIILSATGHLKNAADEKRDWVRRYLGEQFADTAKFVLSASDKAQYATSNSILIDDRRRAIDPWIDAGGIGIHHTSAVNSIDQLRNIGL